MTNGLLFECWFDSVRPSRGGGKPRSIRATMPMAVEPAPGMAIVSPILEAHGGRIESRPDQSDLILVFPSLSEDRA